MNEKVMKNLAMTDEEFLESVDFADRKARINYDRVIVHKKNYAKEFIDFLERNKNTVFTLRPDYTFLYGSQVGHIIYTFREDDTYGFHIADLIIEEAGENN